MLSVVVGMFIACTTSSNSPEKIGRMMFKAVADGDVATIKSLTTEEFFNSEFPMEESQIREILLSAPDTKRDALKYLADKSVAHVTKIDDDFVIVSFTNTENGKEFDMNMRKHNGEWKIDRYGY